MQFRDKVSEVLTFKLRPITTEKQKRVPNGRHENSKELKEFKEQKEGQCGWARFAFFW